VKLAGWAVEDMLAARDGKRRLADRAAPRPEVALAAAGLGEYLAGRDGRRAVLDRIAPRLEAERFAEGMRALLADPGTRDLVFDRQTLEVAATPTFNKMLEFGAFEMAMRTQDFWSMVARQDDRLFAQDTK
jgi:hypothetical protein